MLLGNELEERVIWQADFFQSNLSFLGFRLRLWQVKELQSVHCVWSSYGSIDNAMLDDIGKLFLILHTKD